MADGTPMGDGTSTLTRRLRELAGSEVRDVDASLDVAHVRSIVRRRHRRRSVHRGVGAVTTVAVLIAGLGWLVGGRSPEPAPSETAATAATPASRDALFDALRADDRDLVGRLLTAGADPNSVGLLGTTALTVAAVRGEVAIVETLIAAGADPAGRNNNGTTALHGAAERGHLDVVGVLLGAGAPADPVDDRRTTSPLMRAAAAGQLDVVRALIDGGADPSAVDSGGRPAVLYALGADDPTTVIEAFVEADASIPHPSGDVDRTLRLTTVDPGELVELLRELDEHGNVIDS